MLHEGGELGCVVDAEERVHMIAQDCHREDPHAEQMLRAAKEPDHKFIGGWTGAK
jgi:hypothetical protein